MFLLPSRRYDKVCQLLAAGRWFSLGTPVSATNKTDRHDIAEILLKVALNTINPNPNLAEDDDITRHAQYIGRTYSMLTIRPACWANS